MLSFPLRCAALVSDKRWREARTGSRCAARHARPGAQTQRAAGYFLAPEAFRFSVPAFPLSHLPVFKNETKRPRLKKIAAAAGQEGRTKHNVRCSPVCIPCRKQAK